jgi:hypothetical protein
MEVFLTSVPNGVSDLHSLEEPVISCVLYLNELKSHFEHDDDDDDDDDTFHVIGFWPLLTNHLHGAESFLRS